MTSRSTSSLMIGNTEVKTLQQWSSLGWKVKKGSKAVGTLYGQHVFDRTQVERPPWHYNQQRYEREYHGRDLREVMEPPAMVAEQRGRRWDPMNGYDDSSGDCNCGVGWGGCSCGTRRRPAGPFHSFPDDDEDGDSKWGDYYS